MLPEDRALASLRACCSSRQWAAAVAAGRPYASVDGAIARSDEALAGLTVADLAEALAGHPRIGERASAERASAERAASAGEAPGGDPAGWSGGEQAGVDSADAALAAALAEGNRAYELRFGHIYLVCATGKSGPELLALLRSRLDNDHDTEWRVIRVELGKITRIRLRKLLGGEGPE